MIAVLLLIFVSGMMAVEYCAMTGCADVTKCTCPPFFFDCIVQNDKAGVCAMTEAGTWVIIGLVIGLAILVCGLVVLLCCCCCCKYKGGKAVHHHYKDAPHSV